MKDYRIDVAVKNNLLLSAMASAGFDTAADLFRACGVQQGIIGDLINMKVSPLDKHGEWRKPVESICQALNKMPIDLFNEQQRDRPLKTNRSKIEATAEQVFALASEGTGMMQIEVDEESRIVAEALEGLTEREEKVIRLRFGMDSDALGLREVGEVMGVTQERIRQIEAKALRKLRHPKNSSKLFELHR